MSGRELPDSIAYLKDKAKTWVTAQPPGKIVVYLTGRSLGDFIERNIVAASILRHFPKAHTLVLYRSQGPQWEFVTDCNPFLQSEMKADANSPATFLMDWFDIGWSAPVKCPVPEWTERKLHDPDLILSPSLLSAEAALLEGLAEAPPALILPPEKETGLLKDLAGRGLPRDNWFVCLDGALKETASLVRRVSALGGRAVLLGRGQDPQALDLTSAPFGLQAAAISRARFVIGGDPWITALASAFLTPAAAIGEKRAPIWNKADIAFIQGSASMADLVEHLIKTTPDCPAWRTTVPPPPVTEKLNLAIPMAVRDAPLFTYYPKR